MLDFSQLEILPDLNIYPGGCEYAGKRVRLSPQQNTFLTRLRDRHPEAATFDELTGAIYAGHDWPFGNNIKVYACKIRFKLKKLGLSIENIRGYGYRLVYGRGVSGHSAEDSIRLTTSDRLG